MVTRHYCNKGISKYYFFFYSTYKFKLLQSLKDLEESTQIKELQHETPLAKTELGEHKCDDEDISSN